MDPMNDTMREQLWTVLSDCWLDNELGDDDILRIADSVRETGVSEAEYWDICRYELGPFLCRNGFAAAGVWNGFDEGWVISEARRRREHRGLGVYVAGRLGITLHPAKSDLQQIAAAAFADRRRS
ncbi:DUF7079 family protein [Thiosocius teredinicola]|uniref:DUF7079 family protein n=1 Tax=Thiosocius teredinicola TaxID=1973002 RepID=UPI000990B9CF